MQPIETSNEKRKASLQLEIDRKLSAMPRAQQDLVAAFAKGLKQGLTVRRALQKLPRR